MQQVCAAFAAAVALIALGFPAWTNIPPVLAQPGDKDWIDPPFTGQGERPQNGTTVFVSCYLDRLLTVNQVDYGFQATFYVFLSWEDPNAASEVAEATAKYQNGTSCERFCNRQLAGGPIAQCCDTLWLPTFVLRNVNELPQGRVQPAYITVDSKGIVTWRVQFTGVFYTPMRLKAFPFDEQDMVVRMQMFNWIGQPHIRVVTSAAGTKLFTMGRGDDLSGWRVTNLSITVTEQTFPSQFLVGGTAMSAVDDPAPLRPSPGALAPEFNIGNVTDINIVISVARLYTFFALGAILPVIICTSISFVTFFVDPDKIDTRLQIVVTLFLTLVAIQFVVESELPRSSYVIPTRQLVILSYSILGVIALETLVVFNVANYDKVADFLKGQKHARRKRAAIARQLREASQLHGAAFQLDSALNSVLRLLRGQKRGESPQLTLANSAPKQELGDPEIELSADPKLAFTEAAEPVSEPVTANREPNGGFARGKGGKGGARVAWRSSVQVVKQERKQEAVAAAVEPSATTKSQRWATFLEEEERKWYFLWLAWVIDLGSFAACVIIYAIISILVFVLSR